MKRKRSNSNNCREKKRAKRMKIIAHQEATRKHTRKMKKYQKTSQKIFIDDENQETGHQCNEGDFDFHVAIIENNVPKIKELLLCGEELCTKQGENCFILTNYTKNWSLLEKFFILKPEGIHAKDENGATLFLLNTNNLEMLQFLLKYGADPYVVTNCGNALIYALQNNASIECVELLLNLQIDIHEEDMYGKTALHYATIYARREVVQLLLKGGADVNLKDNQGNTPLLYAARCEDERIIPIIQTLISHGADIHVQDSKGHNPLIVSIITSKCIEVVKILIRSGTNLNLKDISGTPALIYGVQATCLYFARNVVMELLLGNADVNIRDQEGNTALIIVCQSSYREINSEIHLCLFEELIMFKADPNICNYRGYTPLMAACNSIHYPHRYRIIDTLLEEDVNVVARDQNGYNALMYLCEQPDPDYTLRLNIMVALLQKNAMCGLVHFKSPLNPLNILTKSLHCDPTMVYALLKVTADPFCEDDEGCTPIYNIVESYFNNLHTANQQQLEDIMFSVKLIYMYAEKERRFYNFNYHGLEMHPQSLLLQNFNYVDFTSKQQIAEMYQVILNSSLSNTQLSVPDYFTLPENLENLLETNTFNFDTLGCFFKSTMEYIYSGKVVHVIEDILGPMLRLESYGYSLNDHAGDTLSPLTILLSFNIDILSDYHSLAVDPPERLTIDSELINREAEADEQFTDFLLMLINKKAANVAQRMLRFADSILQNLSDELQLPDALWVAAISNNDAIVEYLLDYWPVHPLALLLFFNPRQCNEAETNNHLVSVVCNMFPVLCQGGPLPPGSKLYNKVKNHLNSLWRYYGLPGDIIMDFNAWHSHVPSLRCLSRVALRETLPTSNALPTQVIALIPEHIPDYEMMQDYVQHAAESWELLVADHGRPLKLPPIVPPPRNCFWALAA